MPPVFREDPYNAQNFQLEVQGVLWRNSGAISVGEPGVSCSHRAVSCGKRYIAARPGLPASMGHSGCDSSGDESASRRAVAATFNRRSGLSRLVSWVGSLSLRHPPDRRPRTAVVCGTRSALTESRG